MRAVEEEAERILAANDRIWEFAELPFHEDKSAGLLCGLLEESGFTVETGLAGIPTCFTGTFSFGSGRPVDGNSRGSMTRFQDSARRLPFR